MNNFNIHDKGHTVLTPVIHETTVEQANTNSIIGDKIITTSASILPQDNGSDHSNELFADTSNIRQDGHLQNVSTDLEKNIFFALSRFIYL